MTSNAWKGYRGAPREGTVICGVEDLQEGKPLCLELSGFPVLIVRLDKVAFAYVNACPHQYLPLNHMGDNLISTDRSILRCSNHGAGFCTKTGEGVAGLGLDCSLDPMPVSVVNGSYVIGISAES